MLSSGPGTRLESVPGLASTGQLCVTKGAQSGSPALLLEPAVPS